MKEINMGHFGARIKLAFCKLNKPLFVKKKYLKFKIFKNIKIVVS